MTLQSPLVPTGPFQVKVPTETLEESRIAQARMLAAPCSPVLLRLPTFSGLAGVPNPRPQMVPPVRSAAVLD